jgi:serine/threonine-protein phosphatase 2A regulatory subunit A
MALGDERTRSELLPYLRDATLEEDELMVALAEEVGKLVPLVGGPEHAHCLVPLLEDLSRQDETVVRDEAVRSLQIVGKELSREKAMEHLVPCIKVCWPGLTPAIIF